MARVAAFEVLDPGVLTTIQDLGRQGYRQFGVPPSGAADSFSARVGNLLAGNEEGAACLETTIMGLTLRAVGEIVMAITGGDLLPTLNGEPLEMWRRHLLVEGDAVAFKGDPQGLQGLSGDQRGHRRSGGPGKHVHLSAGEVWRFGRKAVETGRYSLPGGLPAPPGEAGVPISRRMDPSLRQRIGVAGHSRTSE